MSLRRPKVLIVAAVLLALGGVAFYRVVAQPRERATGRRLGGEIPVRVMKPVAGTVQHKVVTTGDILPFMQVEIISKIPGHLERLLVNLGDQVREGQTLAVVDRAELQQRIREIEARVAKARARLNELQTGMRPEEIRQAEEGARQARSRFENAKAQLDRSRELYRQGLLSRRDMDDAENAYTVSEAQSIAADNQLKMMREGARTEVRQVAEAELRENQALLGQERVRLQHTTITAPFSGQISKRYVDPGAFVTTSTPIVTLAHSDTVKVLISVPEKDVPLVRRGGNARIVADAYPNRSFTGEVVRLSSGLDLASRTLQAEVHIPNREHLLKPGMFARIELVLQERPGLLVPAEAVLQEGSRQYLFLVEERKAVQREVATGLLQETRIEIARGLQGGEDVVIAGQHRLKHGSGVQVMGPGGPEAGPDGVKPDRRAPAGKPDGAKPDRTRKGQKPA